MTNDITSVWMIELCNGDPSYGDLYEIIDDYGFFLTEGEAQAKADSLNYPRERYDTDTRIMQRKIDEAFEGYNQRRKDWQELVERDIDPSRFMSKPTPPRPSRVTTFEEWKAHETEMYRPVEVKRG